MLVRYFLNLLFWPVFCVCILSSYANASTANHLIKQGLFNEARALLKSSEHEQYHVHHLEGLIAKQVRDLKKAEAEFRAALAINPNYAPSKRHLAHTLFLAGNYDGATYHYEVLSASAETEVERQSYDRFLEAIKSKRPWSVSAYFGFLPSTNTNKGTDQAIINTVVGPQIITQDSKAQSGIGATLGLSGYYRVDLENNNILLFSGSIGGLLYEDSTFNSVNGVLSTELGRADKSGSLFIGGTVSHSRSDFNTDDGSSGGNKTNTRYGLTIRGTKKLSQTDRLSFSAAVLRQNFSDNPSKDGEYFSANLNWKRVLSQSVSVFTGIGFVRESAEREDLSHNDWKLSAGFTQNWEGGLTTTLYGGYENHRYDENFLLTNRKRQDDAYFLGLSVTHPALAVNGFAPKFTYKYTNQSSNIAFYEFDSHDFGLIWTKRY